MPRSHTPEVHKPCNAEGHCHICDGGLFVCTVCRCIEGSLPTDCPGEAVYGSHGDAIYEGYIDFVDGVWVLGPSAHSPEYWHQRRVTAS